MRTKSSKENQRLKRKRLHLQAAVVEKAVEYRRMCIGVGIGKQNSESGANAGNSEMANERDESIISSNHSDAET